MFNEKAKHSLTTNFIVSEPSDLTLGVTPLLLHNHRFSFFFSSSSSLCPSWVYLKVTHLEANLIFNLNAFTVSNIINVIPLILNQTDNHYASWVEFFNIHVCAYNVKDHMDEKVVKPSDVDKDTRDRLDARVI